MQNAPSPRPEYIAGLDADKGQFLPDGIMPAGGPKVFAMEKFAGKITGPVNVTTTYTNKFAIKANQLEGFTKK